MNFVTKEEALEKFIQLYIDGYQFKNNSSLETGVVSFVAHNQYNDEIHKVCYLTHDKEIDCIEEKKLDSMSELEKFISDNLLNKNNILFRDGNVGILSIDLKSGTSRLHYCKNIFDKRILNKNANFEKITNKQILNNSNFANLIRNIPESDEYMRLNTDAGIRLLELKNSDEMKGENVPVDKNTFIKKASELINKGYSLLNIRDNGNDGILVLKNGKIKDRIYWYDKTPCTVYTEKIITPNNKDTLTHLNSNKVFNNLKIYSLKDSIRFEEKNGMTTNSYIISNDNFKFIVDEFMNFRNGYTNISNTSHMLSIISDQENEWFDLLKQVKREAARSKGKNSTKIELKESSIRIIVKQILKTIKKSLDKQEASAIVEFLNSPVGEGVLCNLISIALTQTPINGKAELRGILAKEFRVQGYAEMGGIVADYLAEPLRDALKKITSAEDLLEKENITEKEVIKFLK